MRGLGRGAGRAGARFAGAEHDARKGERGCSMAASKGFAHIQVSDDEEDVVIQAGVPSAAEGADAPALCSSADGAVGEAALADGAAPSGETAAAEQAAAEQEGAESAEQDGAPAAAESAFEPAGGRASGEADGAHDSGERQAKGGQPSGKARGKGRDGRSGRQSGQTTLEDLQSFKMGTVQKVVIAAAIIGIIAAVVYYVCYM